MEEVAPLKLDYEAALRVVGRHLDAEPAYNISLLEVGDGFTVRTQLSRLHSDSRTLQFTWDRLENLLVFQLAGRGCARRPPRHRGIWANFPNGHEDFLRALGHRLDQEGGSNLSIDEVSEGVTVSYFRLEGDSGTETEKVELLLAYADIEAMLEDARRRRAS